VWRQLLTQPDQAAHAVGKLLSRVGQNRVMWGTDAIWYGSPQPQIMAMRAFQITTEYQDTYGYPALTDDVKANIFGLNAASLFGIDPTAIRCAMTTDPLTANIEESAQLRSDGALPSPWAPHGPDDSSSGPQLACLDHYELDADVNEMQPMRARGRRHPEGRT